MRFPLAPSGEQFGFGGQWGYYTDAETGLVLCTYRYYDPLNARWLNRDPIGYEGGWNTYAYVLGNPTNLTDPLGLDAEMVYVHDVVKFTDIEKQNGTFGYRYNRIPGHAFIRFDHPVTILDPDNPKKTVKVTSIGFYSKGENYYFRPEKSKFEAPDHCEQTEEAGELVRHLRVTKRQKGKAFEKHLIDSINQMIKRRPGYQIPGKVCWDIAETIWGEALIKDGKLQEHR